MAAPAGHPEILVVGGAGVGKKALAARVLARPASGLGTPDLWTIDTKYYTAQTSLVLKSALSDGLAAEQACEAVVLVFDATCEASLVEVQRWAAASALQAAEVRLVVANKVDRLVARLPAEGNAAADPAALERSPWLASAQAWCSENMYEYVEVSAADEGLDSTLELNGERQGVRRVAAALQAHTWPGLTLKRPPASGAQAPDAPPDARPAPAHSAAAGPCNGADSSVLEGEYANHAHVNATQATQPSAAGRCNGATASALQHAVPQANGAASGAVPRGEEAAAHGPDGGGGRATGGTGHAADPDQQAAREGDGRDATPASGGGGSLDLGDGLDDEGLLEDDFEQLMGRMAAERVRIQALPDAQRREAAARMAERMLAAVGLAENDTSDED